MGEPRWTVERDGARLRYSDDVWMEWDDLAVPATIPDSLRHEAFAALVALVAGSATPPGDDDG